MCQNLDCWLIYGFVPYGKKQFLDHYDGGSLLCQSKYGQCNVNETVVSNESGLRLHTQANEVNLQTL